MPSTTKIMISILSGIFILSSCRKNNAPAPEKRSSGDQVRFEVNGTPWTSYPATKDVSYLGYTNKAVEATIKNDTLKLFAFRLTSNDSSFIFIRVPLTAQKLGTYDLKESNNNIYYITGTSLMSTLSLDPMSHFTFNLTSFDATSKKISGTFSGTMRFYPMNIDAYTISNGVIDDVSFQ